MLVIRITSVNQVIIFTKAPSPVAAPFDSWHEGYLKSTKFINLIPSISIALLLQYSGSRIIHRDGFSSCKLLEMRLNW